MPGKNRGMPMWSYQGVAFRKFVSLGVVLAGLLFLAPIMPAAAAGPSDVIRGFYGVLLDTMRQAQQLGPRGRYHKLEPVVLRTVHIPHLAQLSIGPGWDALS